MILGPNLLRADGEGGGGPCRPGVELLLVVPRDDALQELTVTLRDGGEFDFGAQANHAFIDVCNACPYRLADSAQGLTVGYLHEHLEASLHGGRLQTGDKHSARGNGLRLSLDMPLCGHQSDRPSHVHAERLMCLG